MLRNFDNVKVGDKLKVREDLEVGQGHEYPLGVTKVVERMLKYAGKVFTVSKVLGHDRIQFEELGYYTWTHEMIEKKVGEEKMVKNLKVGDKVKVREDLQKGISYKMNTNEFKNSAVEEMIELAGEIVEVTNAFSQYRVNDLTWAWTDEMFEYKVEEEEKMLNFDDVKVGDKLKIKEKLILGDSQGYAEVTHNMLKYEGQVFTVEAIGSAGGEKYVRFEEIGYQWNAGMIEYKAEDTHMGKVAVILGIELGEEFILVNKDGYKIDYNPYKFTRKGFVDRDGDTRNSMLGALIHGEYSIKETKENDYSEVIEEKILRQSTGVICSELEFDKMLEILDDSGIEYKDEEFLEDDNTIFFFEEDNTPQVTICELDCFVDGCLKSPEMLIKFDRFADIIGYKEVE